MRALRDIVLTDYLINYSAEQNLSKWTVKSKRGVLTRLFNWLGDKPLTAASCREYAHYLLGHGYKPSSLKQELVKMRAMVRFLKRRGFIKKDFSADVPLPRVPRCHLEIIPIELAEQVIIAGTEPGPDDHKLHRISKEDQRQALRFILRSGLRNRELRDLRPEDINLENKTYVVHSKSQNVDVLPFPQDMIEEIKKRLGNRGKLFPVSAGVMNSALKHGCQKLGVTTKLTCHGLRHTFCTSLLRRGASMQLVSRLMRHSSAMITDVVYSHYLLDDLAQTLNSKHPLIFYGLSKEQTFDLVEQAVRGTAVSTDKRFGLTVERLDGELVIKVRYN